VSDDVLKEVAPPYQVTKYRSPYQPLIDELYREEVLDARRMDPEEKLILGERLFLWACSVTLEGIRMQNPGASEADCQRLLRERLELGRRLESAS
jgi:hypothetical protein